MNEMTLIRINGAGFPQRRNPPHPVGRTLTKGKFYGLEGYEDLPICNYAATLIERLPLEAALASGRVWMRNAESRHGKWREIKAAADIPALRVVVCEGDYDTCSSMSVLPYMPEFYHIPREGVGAYNL